MRQIILPSFGIYCFQDSYGGYMVAFSGRKYAARSPAAFVANSTYTVTSFTLVRHPYQLASFFWKRKKKNKSLKNRKEQIANSPLLFHIKANVICQCRYLNSKRVDYKTSIGKGMGVRHAQATLTSCALTNRIVQSKLTTVRIKEARLIAALGYNWHSLVQISMIQFLTRGMKWKTFASIPFITFIQVSRILSLASIINTSDLLTCCL